MSDRRKPGRWRWAVLGVVGPGVLLLASLFITARLVAFREAVRVIAYDALARTGQPVELRVALQRGAPLRPAVGESVEFRIPDSETRVDTTDSAGIASAEVRFEDDGEQFVALRLPETFAATDPYIHVFVRSPETRMIVCDVEGILRPGNAADSSDWIADSVEVMRRLSRTRFMAYRTTAVSDQLPDIRRWLREAGYPVGPILGHWTPAAVVAPSTQSSTWIDTFVKRWPNVEFAVTADPRAARLYTQHGVPSFCLSAEAQSAADHSITFVADRIALRARLAAAADNAPP